MIIPPPAQLKVLTDCRPWNQMIQTQCHQQITYRFKTTARMGAIELRHSHPKKPNKHISSFFVSFVSKFWNYGASPKLHAVSYIFFFPFCFQLERISIFISDVVQCPTAACLSPVQFSRIRVPALTNTQKCIISACQVGPPVTINQLMRSVSCRHVPHVSMQS